MKRRVVLGPRYVIFRSLSLAMAYYRRRSKYRRRYSWRRKRRSRNSMSTASIAGKAYALSRKLNIGVERNFLDSGNSATVGYIGTGYDDLPLLDPTAGAYPQENVGYKIVATMLDIRLSWRENTAGQYNPIVRTLIVATKNQGDAPDWSELLEGYNGGGVAENVLLSKKRSMRGTYRVLMDRTWTLNDTTNTVVWHHFNKRLTIGPTTFSEFGHDETRGGIYMLAITNISMTATARPLLSYVCRVSYIDM